MIVREAIMPSKQRTHTCNACVTGVAIAKYLLGNDGQFIAISICPPCEGELWHLITPEET